MTSKYKPTDHPWETEEDEEECEYQKTAGDKITKLTKGSKRIISAIKAVWPRATKAVEDNAVEDTLMEVLDRMGGDTHSAKGKYTPEQQHKQIHEMIQYLEERAVIDYKVSRIKELQAELDEYNNNLFTPIKE